MSCANEHQTYLLYLIEPNKLMTILKRNSTPYYPRLYCVHENKIVNIL